MDSPICLDRVHSRLVDEIAQREFGIPGLELMENAGRECAEFLRSEGPRGGVLICCGSGNNAGDGLVMARHLAAAGVDVEVWLAFDPVRFSPDARINYVRLHGRSVRILRLDQALPIDLERLFSERRKKGVSWLVDGLLGTGAIGPPRPPIDGWIEAMNGSELPILALDIPSGLDCDSGTAAGPCIRAAATCSFVALKPCYSREPGKSLAGKVRVIDIGVPQEVIRQVEQRQRGLNGIDFEDAGRQNGASHTDSESENEGTGKEQ